MIVPEAAHKVLKALENSTSSRRALRLEAMQSLSSLPDYNWCGVYRLQGRQLILDEFVGDPTDHTVIPVGKGVCGVAVEENKNQVIEDVHALSNYLSSSIKTKAE